MNFARLKSRRAISVVVVWPAVLVVVAGCLAAIAFDLYVRASPVLPAVGFSGTITIQMQRQPMVANIVLFRDDSGDITIIADMVYRSPPEGLNCLNFSIDLRGDARLLGVRAGDDLTKVGPIQNDEAGQMVFGSTCKHPLEQGPVWRVWLKGRLERDMVQVTSQAVVARGPIVVGIDQGTVEFWIFDLPAPADWMQYKVESSSPDYVGPGLHWRGPLTTGLKPFVTLINIPEEKFRDRLLFWAGIIAGLASSLIILALERVIVRRELKRDERGGH